MLNYVRVCIIIHNLLICFFPNFELGDIDLDMQISQTEGNRVNVDVNTDSYTSGKNRRQQVYDRLLYDGVYERVIADRLKALTQDCFD